MQANKILYAVALAAASFAAQASSETWLFELDGFGTAAAGGTQGCGPENPDQCLHDVTWRGTFSVETAGSADGTYVGDDVLEIRLVSNFVSYDFTSFPYSPAWQVPPSVTISGGEVTSINVQYSNDGQVRYPPDYFTVDGLRVYFTTSGYHEPFAELFGSLSSIPEPGGAAPVLAGLAILALFARRPDSHARRRA